MQLNQQLGLMELSARLGGSGDDHLVPAMQQTRVFPRANQEEAESPENWDWTLIGAVITWPGTALSDNLDVGGGGASVAGGSIHFQFVRRIQDFFRPTKNEFAAADVTARHIRAYVDTGCKLLQFLLGSKSVHGLKYINDYIILCHTSLHLFAD